MIADVENKFKALSDKTRLAILKEISCCKELCVSDLQKKFHISQSKLSYHLKLLVEAGILTRCERGTWRYYQVDDKEVQRILSPMIYQEIIKNSESK
ncbi:ArsR/SmtB family transcription factor [Priestia megaterium]|uniref:ArsR/SmtB family transcription factor n=1 Tax=Priestia megaterium TaxID=1404 RepID=UPI001EEE7083|nr:metalloregulator ArsR/SmtB family transcription factor [Priestia megaterium]MCF8890645.1 metalloregulator ArsR/SmtB family transcription factor [Priestia megaterium]